MPTKYRKGFKVDAESIAEELRVELKVGNIRALDPMAAARALEIPVLSLAQLRAVRPQDSSLEEAVRVLYGPEQSSLSAVTVFLGTKRLIVYNQQHDAGRQASDICHELAHGLLFHEPAPMLDDIGCRSWNSEMEQEADYLGGALLIPGKGARYAAKAGLTDEETARRFRCSREMATWRLNESGGRKLAPR